MQLAPERPLISERLATNASPSDDDTSVSISLLLLGGGGGGLFGGPVPGTQATLLILFRE